MRQDLHDLAGLASQPRQLLVPLLYLLCQALVLNLQLLKVNEVQPLSHLLLQSSDPRGSLHAKIQGHCRARN